MADLTEFIKDDPIDSSTAPQGTATKPQGTATGPQSTATGPRGEARSAKGSLEAFSNDSLESFATDIPTGQGTLLSSGNEGSILLQPDHKILKVYTSGRPCNRKVLPLVKQLNGKGYAVELYDFGTMDYNGQPCDFELMQYCPLGPVSNRMDLKGNADAILKITISTAMAIHAFHQAGIIHKDIKPANILIENDKTWHCVVHIAETDVFVSSAIEADKILENGSNASAQLLQIIIAHINTINQNSSFVSVIQAQ